jgi:hypothetical protein
MMPLDDRTAERIARVIVDIGGPYERPSWELERLLAGAGWSDPPPYDQISSRVGWLTEQLIERKDNRADIERLLCRVCDPLEYDDGKESAEEFRSVLNAVLEAEGLVVSTTGGRPVLGTLSSTGNPIFSAPEDLDGRLGALIDDNQAVTLLMRRVQETLICERNGAHTMAIIGIGSIAEGLLYSLLTERDADINRNGFPLKNGKRLKPEQAGLALMIDIAYDKGWIQLDARDFMHNVRQYRNFVHPRLELEKQPQFDQDSVNLCWAPVRALLNDLEEHIGPAAAPAQRATEIGGGGTSH